SRGRLAYVPREGLGPRAAIGAIRAAGGMASLAHYSEAVDHLDWIEELIEMGLNGLEVHYRAFDPDTVRTMRGIATDHGLVWTGGTDYHGDRETYAEAQAQLWNPPEVADGIRSALGLGVRSATD